MILTFHQVCVVCETVKRPKNKMKNRFSTVIENLCGD